MGYFDGRMVGVVDVLLLMAGWCFGFFLQIDRMGFRFLFEVEVLGVDGLVF